jgi:hypothetical protein
LLLRGGGYAYHYTYPQAPHAKPTSRQTHLHFPANGMFIIAMHIIHFTTHTLICLQLPPISHFTCCHPFTSHPFSHLLHSTPYLLQLHLLTCLHKCIAFLLPLHLQPHNPPSWQHHHHLYILVYHVISFHCLNSLCI